MAIYVLTRITGTTEAGYQLTDKQIEEHVKKRKEVITSVGGKPVAIYGSYVGGRGGIFIHSYPSLEAAEKARIGVWSRQGLNTMRYWTYEQDILYERPLDS